MTKTVYATLHDREWLHLEEPMELPANVRVRITIESGEEQEATPARSFLDVVQGLNLDGPSDLSTRFHDHLYGNGDSGR
jgi:hypothetical protein